MGEDGAFGRLLLRLRKKAGLSQQELARAANVSASTIGALEHGKYLPQPLNRRALADALNLAGPARDAFIVAGDPGAGPSAVGTGIVAPPRPTTWLADRRDEITALAGLLAEDGRFVMVTGPAGVGKSRLALEVAATLADTFPDGIAFADLADLPDSGPILPAIATAVDLTEPGVLPLLPQIAARLRGRRLLLVLDNIDPVVEAARQIVDLLAAAPPLRVLVTSREALGVTEEEVFRLAPLDLTASAALFTERARRAGSSPSPIRSGVDQASDITLRAICGRLDGLPLAIELAARLHFLSPLQLYAGLGDRLRLLALGSRDFPARHRALRVALDESHARLTPEERIVFRRLATFRGGWTHEAAEAVCDPFVGQVQLSLIVPLILRALMNKSLVHGHGEGAYGPRFSLLDTTREYAAEHLAESGEEDVVRDRHADYYLEAAAAVAAQTEAGDTDAFAGFLPDEENFRAALLYLVAVGDRERVMWAARLLPLE